MRENKRMITRAIRELDREKTGLEREEKRLTMEIKKAARENQMSSVKVMAKVSSEYTYTAGGSRRSTDRLTARASATIKSFVSTTNSHCSKAKSYIPDCIV